MRILSLSVAVACLAFPLASLSAQGEASPGHGRLGIFLGGQSDRSDTLGAKVRGVVPDGPAAKAGIQRGDLIVRFNGTAIHDGRMLAELARGLQPGDSARIEYRRDGRGGAAVVIADRMGPRFAMMFRRFPHGGGFDMMFFRAHRPGGLELVQLSRDLGEYFGTSEGLLVIKPPADSTSPLKAGDVILAIDGRKPQSVPHALRILGSYAPGEKAKLEIMRKRQRTTVTWTAPEHRRGTDGRRGQDSWRGMAPGDRLESWGAMDFDLPVPSPDDDFMLTVPPQLDAEDT